MVPPPGRDALIQQLHHGHIGITRMKALAQSYFWWPKLDADIEAVVKRCVVCQDTVIRQLQHHFILGSGRANHGKGYTLIMRDHSWAPVFDPDGRSFQMDGCLSCNNLNFSHYD